jgi:hypothetical protein
MAYYAFGDPTMADIPEAPTPAGLPGEERAGFFPRRVYEPPQNKSRFRSFRDTYGVYGGWLIVSGLLASLLGWFAYRLDREHFWFHVCLEVAIASLMLVLTVMFVERMLEYRREQERKERWAIIREDTFYSLEAVLENIVGRSIYHLLNERIPATRRQHTSSAYYEVEQDLRKKREALTEATEAVQAWEQKITAWHDTLAPVFNMLRTVTVPQFLHSTRNRTLLRLLLGLQADICFSEIQLSYLRLSPAAIAINLEGIAITVQCCALIQWYLEQAKVQGLKDVDDWAEY